MALNEPEIQRLQSLSDEMAKLIEDVQNTSNEASVVYGKIGRACARALANVAATTAKQAKRVEHVQKFQAARQSRQQKKAGTAAGTPPQSAARAGSTSARSA